MVRRLPPLNALRAFEAAARHLSYAKAAEELFVTPAAISHQVKALEDHIGIALFRRLPRGLALTDAGRALLPDLTEGLDRLSAATQRLPRDGLSGRLTVTVLPSFAYGWLVPRLKNFHRRCPDIDVLLRSEIRSVDFETEDIDIGIRYGPNPGEVSGGTMHALFLLDEEVFPVCAPSLINAPRPLRRAEDLAHHTLLHDGDIRAGEPWLGWPQWLRALGIDGRVDAERGPRFTDATPLILAAVLGQGVAIGRSAILHDHLTAGRLVRRFELVRPADFSYWLVCSPQRRHEPKIAVFIDWLLEEAANWGN